MNSLSPQVVSAAKLPILNPNEFNLWKMRIEQYFLMTDYSLWEVILNGDSLAPTRVVEARGTLLMALPDKHQLKFNSHKDDKTLIEAIEKRFRGNTKTKKVQKTLLKQQYENFTGSSSESLDQIHDRLQKLISQLEIHRVSLSQEDVNLNLKIYEAKVKNSSCTGTTTPNLAFVSSSNTDSTTEPVSADASVSAICAKMFVSSLPNQINVDDLEEMDLKWQMAMLTIRARRFLHRTGRYLGANGPTSLGFDMSKVECYNCHMKGHFAREFRFTRAMFDYDDYLSSESDESWPPSSLYDRFQSSVGYHAVLPPYIRTFMPPKPDLVFNNAPNGVETDHFAFTIKLSPTKPDQALSHTIRSFTPIIKDWHVATSILAATPKPASPKPTGNGKRRNRKACFVCKSLDHLIKDCNYHEKKMAQPTARNHVHRGNHKHYASMTHQYPQKHMVSAAILTQSKPVPITAVRPGNTVVPKITVTRPKHAKQIVTKPKSLIKRHIYRSPSLEVSNSPPRVTAVKAPVVNAAQGLQGKWEWKPKCLVLDHVSRNTSASMTLKRFDYNDALGRSKSGRMTAEIDQDADIVIEDDKEVADDVKDVQDNIDESAQDQGRKAESQAEIYKIDLEHANKVLSMQKDESEPAKVQEVVDVVTTAKLITEVVTAVGETITVASTIITAAEAQVLVVTLTASPARVTAASSRRRKGVVIRDPKEELEAELNRTIDWNEVINQVKKKAKEDPAVKRYQALKRKPQTKAHARKNMMIYLKNVTGFKMDYFKGMSYDDIRPVFEKYFDSNVAFLIKSKEQMDEEDSRALKRLNETLIEKAAKKQNLDEELILLVERKYPLTKFTLDQMQNVVRLEVEEESEVSLELLRFIRQQHQEGAQLE
uniref:Uncharacterized protein n=1 Tax=Tanacetum cinerariifolium TaxID=118510 RepID=A0A6L2KE88_TANCI|nr:hypothetical protein [Tanacetum cinerariifolium]